MYLLEDIENELSGLKPETFPKRYSFHKYWGKRPANIFSELIDFFSNEDEKILDPFNGSGITITEAIIKDRQGYGFDLNPIAVDLTRATIEHTRVKDFLQRSNDLVSRS